MSDRERTDQEIDALLPEEHRRETRERQAELTRETQLELNRAWDGLELFAAPPELQDRPDQAGHAHRIRLDGLSRLKASLLGIDHDLFPHDPLAEKAAEETLYIVNRIRDRQGVDPLAGDRLVGQAISEVARAQEILETETK
jgi:hypothetical protein